MANVNVTVTINATGASAGAQAFSQSVNQMAGSVSAFSPQLAQINGNINAVITAINNLSQANRSAASTFAAFTGAALAADALRSFGSALEDLLVNSTLYAARTQELGVALDAVAKATGANTELIAQQEFAMRQLNITTQDARNVLTKFMQTDLDLNKSGALARTAQDLAVIAKVSTSEEINKLIIGIQTLQSRNLRTAGVFLTVDEVLDRLSKTTHRARDSFSTFEKQQAVLNAVIEFGARVTGTYEAAMETASKQIRSMERLIFEAQNAIGNQFIPVLELLVSTTSDMFVAIEKHPTTFTVLITSVGLLTAAFTILNSGFVMATAKAGAFVLQGLLKMAMVFPGLSARAGAASASLAAYTGVTAVATTSTSALAASVATLEVVLGGIGVVLGIAGLVFGLAAAFGSLTDTTEDYKKVADSVILQGSQQVKTYTEQIAVLNEYNASRKELQNAELQRAVDNLRAFQQQKAQTDQYSEAVNKATVNIAQLHDEEANLLKQRKDLAKIDVTGVSTAPRSGAIGTREKEIKEALAVQQQAQAVAQKGEETSRAFQEATRQNLQKQLDVLGVTAEELNRHLELEKQRDKIYDSLNSKQKAGLEIQQNLIDVNKTLIEQQQKAAAVTAGTLATNIKLAKEELTTAEQTGDQLQKQFNARIQYQDLLERNALPGGREVDSDALSRRQEVGRKAVQALEKDIAAQGEAWLLAKGKVDEYDRQLGLLITSYGLSSDALARLVVGVKENDEVSGALAIRIDTLAKTFDDARLKAAALAAQLHDASLGSEALKEAISKISLKPLEPTGAEKLSAYGRDLQTIVVAVGELHGIKGLDLTKLSQDEQLYNEFLERTTGAGKQFIEEINKKFHGDIELAVKSSFMGLSSDRQDFIIRWLNDQKRLEAEARKAANTVKTEYEKMQESLTKVNAQIDSFLHVGSQEFKLRMQLEDAEKTKKDLETIFTLRHKLGIPLDIKINREDIQKTRQELEILAKVFDEIRVAQNAVLEAQLKAGAPVVDAQVRAETILLKLVRDRREQEQQLQAEIAAGILKRMQLEENAHSVQQIQAQAFLDSLNEEQKTLDDALQSATRLSMTQGNFSFADNNSIIQNALKIANDPVVQALTDTQKVISDSVKTITSYQVDFSKALGDSILKSSDLLKIELKDSNLELKNHTTILKDIANNTAAGGGGGGIGGVAPGVSLGQFATKGALTVAQMNTLARMAGATPSQARILAAIGMQESSGLPGNQNLGDRNAPEGSNRRNERSYGLWQINIGRGGNTGLGLTPEQLKDPFQNAVAALHVLRTQGFGAWTTYSSGAYKKSLEGADEAPKSTLDYAKTKLTPKIPVAKQIANLLDAFLGRGKGKTLSGGISTDNAKYLELFGESSANLGLPYTPSNFALFHDKAGISALGKANEERRQLIETNNERERAIELRKQTLEYEDEEHLRTLRLTQAEADLNRIQKVRLDNEFELSQAQRELNRLSSDAIVITEQLQQIALERTRAEIELKKAFLRTQEESNRRTDPTLRAHDVNLLLQKEYDQRIRDEQNLDDRLAVLRNTLDSGYLTSIDNQRRIQKQAAVARLEEQSALTNRLIELEDELAHHTENDALRYKVAWKEALLEVENRHKDAIERILKDEASIADQSTIDVARIRATVLDSINATQGISESIGGLFNDTFKVYADDIDKWIDKTTERMGNLGKIFNSFFKSIAQRVVGNIKNSLLNILFPETAAEAGAKQGVAGGGADKNEAAFKTATQNILGLAQVAQGTAGVTVETAGAMQGLTRSVFVASEALIQFANVLSGERAVSAGGGGGGLNIGSLLSPVLSGGGGGGFSSRLGGLATLGLPGLGASPVAAGRSSISNIFANIPNPFSASGGRGGGGIPASVTALLQKMKSGPISTTPVELLATLPQLSKQGSTGVIGKAANVLGGGGGLGSLFSKTGIKGLLGGLTTQLPFIGMGLGASLGGSSPLGSLMGGIGGLLLGGSGSAAQGGLFAGGAGGLAGAGAAGLGGLAAGVGGGSAGLLGSLTALFSNPITAIVGGALLVGAVIIGKNKQRRAEEKIRSELAINLRTTLYQILADIKSDKLDGATGISQANQAIEAYRQQASQLKDRKTREHAIGYLNDVQPIVQQIQQAAKLQTARQDLVSKLIPTYAGGGIADTNWIRVSHGERMEFPSGRSLNIPGQFDAKDNILAYVPTGTKIKSPHPQAVHRYATGGIAGIPPSIRSSASSNSLPVQVTVINVMSEREAIELSKKIPNSVIGDKAAADSKLRPNSLPAAVGRALSSY